MNLNQAVKCVVAIAAITVSVSFNSFNHKKVANTQKTEHKLRVDTSVAYKNLVYQKAESLIAAPGTKSVLFNSLGSKLYAMNLEGMSVYEFDEASRKITREFKFKPTKASGWDYATHQPVPSFEEKPVEACFSHNDKILWVSLHNAHGIVPINLQDLPFKADKKITTKKVYVKDMVQQTKDSVYVPFIKTGKTPKVIARTGDNKYVLVSNWHSNNVSVLETNDTVQPYGKVIATIPVSAIPRGIAVDDTNNKSYIAIMGGKTISVVNNDTWKIEKEIKVASTPRHIVMDNKRRLFISYNSIGKIACINPATGETLFSASTNAQPRTIILSKNQQFLFVTCYSGNTVDVFKINNNSFTKLYSLECKGKPVGVDVYEDDAKLEAWVCNYIGGSLKVFTFKKE
jgi:YVTN family beta-propeller protein